MTSRSAEVDVAIVGAGAAGLATAIFVLRQAPSLRVALLDGARRPGAKILVSGGARCNVTNVTVLDSDFNGGRPSVIRSVLRSLPVPDTVAFFESIGVPLHEEHDGKLFPDSNRARDVLDALLGELRRLGTEVRCEHRVTDVASRGDAFAITTSHGLLTAGRVVLATGGLSLPKTGSDGGGYTLARRLGHSLVPTTPALAPLLLESSAVSSGVTHRVRLELRVVGAVAERTSGSMLWTHFGISGPVALDMSRHWLRHRLEGGDPTLFVSLRPDDSFDALEAQWLAMTRAQPRVAVQTAMAAMLPTSLAQTLVGTLALTAATLSELTRDDRRRLVRAMLEWPLAVTGSRGYSYAEATAGGIALEEVAPGTMESRCRSGLYLVGEVLDVDGRIGGFNFQWAWSSAFVAARALAHR